MNVRRQSFVLFRPAGTRWARLAALTTAGAIAVTGLSGVPSATAISSPAAISSVTAAPGAGPSEIVVSWQSSGANTDYFLLQTAHTSFDAGSSSARGFTSFRISASQRSFFMKKSDTLRAGAVAGTGRHLYYRLVAVNIEGDTTRSRFYPYLQAVLPQGEPAKTDGTRMRVATFNVRTAKARSDKRHWQVRKDEVAQEIVDSGASVVAIQEMSPGRADGKDGSTLKIGRQTTTLLTELAKIGASRFKLVRTTSYRKSGVKHGSQGARILYDSERYKLVSDCPEKTGKKYYNASCTIQMPILSNDSESRRRKAAYGLLEDRKSGQQFYVVSAHLDQRHSGSASSERRYNQLRGDQVRAIVAGIDMINTRGRPVIFGGDINSWQNNRIGHAPHDALIDNGYYDTASAVLRVNFDYPTINHYKTELPRSAMGIATRIDAVLVQGSRGADLYWNKTKVRDTTRPSDHNLVAADIVL